MLRPLAALALVLATCLPAGPARAAEADVAAKAADPQPRRFGGSLILETAVGRGSFIRDEAVRRPLVTLLVGARPRVTLSPRHRLSLTGRFDVSVNVVENADSTNTHRQQAQPSDLRFVLDAEDLLRWEAGDVALSASATWILPTSRLSRFTKKIMAGRAGLSLAWTPVAPLEVSYAAGFTKSWHRYTTAVLDDDRFTIRPLSRAGGAEEVAEGLTATALGIPSFTVDHALSVEVTVIDRLTFGVGLELFHGWTYQDLPRDALSSPYAHAGRGRSDVMVGSLEVGFEVFEHLTLALGTLTEQAPKHLDNRGLRFPFWDTTNGAANRQVVYLDVTGKL